MKCELHKLLERICGNLNVLIFLLMTFFLQLSLELLTIQKFCDELSTANGLCWKYIDSFTICVAAVIQEAGLFR